MATMERRKTLTMNWDGLGEDDDEHFFETYSRLSTVDPGDLGSSSDDDEEFVDPRTSFASTISSMHSSRFGAFSRKGTIAMAASSSNFNYDIWMGAPGSITERRKRLLGSMGLDENKDSLKVTDIDIVRAITKKFEKNVEAPLPSPPLPLPLPPPPPSSSSTRAIDASADVGVDSTTSSSVSPAMEEAKTECCPVSSVLFGLVRSRSEGDIESISMAKARKEELIGKISKQRITRTTSEISVHHPKMTPSALVVKEPVIMAGEPNHNRKVSSAGGGVGAFFLIKNLDTGKEFIVNEYGEDGMWNRLSDLETGKQLTMEEFEKTVGHSAVVKEYMRRAKAARSEGMGKNIFSNSYISRSLRLSKKRGASLLKNIKGVASGRVAEKEKEAAMADQKPQGKNEWVKVRQSGKSQKELSALHMCQEFQAHKGCIWTLKFSCDGRFLASGGEDTVVYVWEVQECEVMSLKAEEGNLTPIHPSLLEREAIPLSSEKKKKGKSGGGKKGGTIPEYVHVPETVFTFSDKPFCSFHGHSNEILDLSWSKSQLLLSSSMDKTVRLWDLETKTCLKFFAHNDYVTCVQFNPVTDDYFISGSLDAKVRIWNIPARHVADWTDVHEMVTSVSYTPDGQAALVGTQKGGCRTYKIEDNALSQTGTIELRRKKKSQLRKITGVQYSPSNPSKALVTSGDSRIKIVDNLGVVHKFTGFRNTDSHIAASFSPNGRYIICASEDSNVYVWKHEEPQNPSTGKARTVTLTQSYECFTCKDVSVAIPWPCTIKGNPPIDPSQHPKKNTKRSTPGPDDQSSNTNNKKSMLPPLPKKTNTNNNNNNNNNNGTESASASPEHDPASISNTEPGIGDSFANSKRMLPPIPNKKTNNNNNQAMESECSSPEDEPEAISHDDSGLSDSFASGSASIRCGDSPSISSNYASSSSSCDTSNGASTTSHNSAWGMVIVTAGYGGEIRCYQNFGLPRRMNRQTNLFGGPT